MTCKPAASSTRTIKWEWRGCLTSVRCLLLCGLSADRREQKKGAWKQPLRNATWKKVLCMCNKTWAQKSVSRFHLPVCHHMTFSRLSVPITSTEQSNFLGLTQISSVASVLSLRSRYFKVLQRAWDNLSSVSICSSSKWHRIKISYCFP